jgi:hemerythrin-like domain-containing protein
MQSVQILRAEHDAVLGVLQPLEEGVGLAEQGVPVPRDFFVDVQEFFAVFVERCHHGREEAAVFGQLDAEPPGHHVVSHLDREHEAGRRLARAYADAVASYRPGDRLTAARLKDAVSAYGTLLRQHIDEESTELFPLMEQTLTAAKDDRIARAFDRLEVEAIGEGTHERLHGMIDSLPGRLARWKTEARSRDGSVRAADAT